MLAKRKEEQVVDGGGGEPLAKLSWGFWNLSFFLTPGITLQSRFFLEDTGTVNTEHGSRPPLPAAVPRCSPQ